MAKRAWSTPRITLLGSPDEISDFVGSSKLSEADADRISHVTDAVAAKSPSAALASARR
jgi:hypothetical protein